jgi:hypothetical protein
MERLLDYLPRYLRTFKELKVLYNSDGAVQKMMEEAEDFLDRIEQNIFFTTADKEGVKMYENRLSIPGSDEEDLEFRRSRLYNRYSFRPPYTRGKTEARFQDILEDDSDTVKIDVDYNNHKATVTLINSDESFIDEVKKTIVQLFPASLEVEIVISDTAEGET